MGDIVQEIDGLAEKEPASTVLHITVGDWRKVRKRLRRAEDVCAASDVEWSDYEARHVSWVRDLIEARVAWRATLAKDG